MGKERKTLSYAPSAMLQYRSQKALLKWSCYLLMILCTIQWQTRLHYKELVTSEFSSTEEFQSPVEISSNQQKLVETCNDLHRASEKHQMSLVQL